MSDRAKRLRTLNFCLLFLAISVSLFAIGVAVRVSRDWKTNPLKDIDDGHFSLLVDDRGKVLINYSCEGEYSQIQYDVATRQYNVSPISNAFASTMITWFSERDKEIYGLSAGAPVAITAGEVLFSWRVFQSDRLEGIRFIRSIATNKTFWYGVATVGGYFAGDYVGGLINVGCYKPGDLAWLQGLDWNVITQGLYTYTMLKLGRCMQDHKFYVQANIPREYLLDAGIIQDKIMSQTLPIYRRLHLPVMASQSVKLQVGYQAQPPKLEEIRNADSLLRECSSVDQFSTFSEQRLAEAVSVIKKNRTGPWDMTNPFLFNTSKVR
ncbi:hypothetical protein K9B32_21530 [Rhizobium sp. 3T7]|uniref:hypothetical protein n=1 Tax=Rhizobium sp. 3T7 TaxID=2874922 RepID=UPI001CC9254A|nr:hypothetical protein [Rhizobium sp. 3T7]MBZ9792656.1 hypothetical protein [Rhizobium sp. 3T7]